MRDADPQDTPELRVLRFAQDDNPAARQDPTSTTGSDNRRDTSKRIRAQF